MDAHAIKEWSNALAPYVAFFTAFWAILTYRRAKKVEVARLQKQIFDDVYLSGRFGRIRHALDLDFQAKIVPILVRIKEGREGELGQEERALLLELDDFLNLIEYVLYLEQDKKLITAHDREALLAYWIELVGDTEHAALRDYLAYGYERLAKCVKSKDKPE
ncbi:MAG: hypothetical protein JOZ90_06565 [Alphaproteobacteria bacterium]|nr:hypothetical protein [Alphaproteobacteria bacterium]MBV9370070.1 hypothetical protein [Alphaproteobacteria bacterium]MBV9900744.1 hypothetical protein [Alphaproteobacteria bacterium]